MRVFLFLTLVTLVFMSCAGDTPEKVLDKCNDIKCSNNGICAIDINNNTVCICNEGFHADKLECIADEVVVNPCKDITSCDEHGSCAVNGVGNAVCVCDTDFHADGMSCVADDVVVNPCEDITTCSPNGECAVDADNNAVCACSEGFHADGMTCIADVVVNPCEDVTTCSPNGICALDADNNAICACNKGYHADENTLTCVVDSTDLCDGVDCGNNALCDSYTGDCYCKSGYNDDVELGTCVANTCGTGDDVHEIEKIEGNFYEFVKNYDYLPKLNDDGTSVNPDEVYIKPPENYVTAFRASVKSLIKGDICTAEEEANNADMKIIKYIDTRDDLTINSDLFTNEYICIMGKDEDNDVNHDPSYFRGLFCMRNYIETNTYTRNLHIAIPHPLHDGNTNIEGAEVFENSGARYFSLSTTHRCADPVDTPCTTSAGTHICNGDSYKISDMAHNVTSLFYQFAKQIQDLDTSYHFQIHGFSEDVFPERVAIATIGSSTIKVNSNRLVRRFTNKLNSLVVNVDSSKKVISCNDGNITDETRDDDGKNVHLIKLCATTNTIGRYINGAVNNSCTTDGLTFAHSRFLHLEQTRWLRGNSTYDPKYNLVTETVNSIFPAVLVLKSSE